MENLIPNIPAVISVMLGVDKFRQMLEQAAVLGRGKEQDKEL